MISMDEIHNKNQEANWDVYAKEYTEYLVENDAIEPREAAFLQGYNNALD
jgi:hypothetical protein